MNYIILLLIFIFINMPAYSAWNPKYDFLINNAYEDGCYKEAKCFEQAKKQNIEIKDGSSLCEKEVKECLEIVKIKQSVANAQYDSNLRQIQANQIQNLQNAIILQQFQINQRRNHP